jgi:predicted protein tyrosine phosphatase
MFQLKICGVAELHEVIAAFQPTHIISTITQSEALDLPGAHLHINVGDITSELDGHVLPTMHHLVELLNFTKDLTDDDRLLIHCFAGMSRSTAFAVAVLIQHGMDYDKAFDHVALLRPILLPNRLIIKLVDQYFALRGDLIDLVRQYYVGQYNRSTAETPDETMITEEWMEKLDRILRRIGSD